MEMQQWHDACANCQDSQDGAGHTGARASMAKGQAEKKQSRTAAATAETQAANGKYDDWAGECLFNWYNS